MEYAQIASFHHHSAGGITASAPGADLKDYVKVSEDAKLVYETAPLADPLTITGHPVVHLWVSATAKDLDVYANLEDIAPDGTATSYYMDGRLRASHREQQDPAYDNLGLPWRTHLEKDTTPLKPNESAELVFDLFPISYRFQAGHRMRVTLTFGDPLDASPEVTIHRSEQRPSSLVLPVSVDRARNDGSSPSRDGGGTGVVQN